MAEEAEHGHGAVHRIEDRAGHFHVAGHQGVAQGDEVSQQVELDLRVAADMAAIGQQLAIKLTGDERKAAAQPGAALAEGDA